MKQPIIAIPKEKSGVLKKFGGITHREKLDSDFLNRALNLSSREYPYLTTRRSREEIGRLPGNGEIQGVLKEQSAQTKLSDLTFVRGNKFYYKGNEILPDSVLGKSITSGKKELLDFDGKIFILPDALYYDYQAAEKGGSDGLKKMSHTVDVNFSIFSGMADGEEMRFLFNRNIIDADKVEAFCKTFMEMHTGDYLTVENVGDVQKFQTMKTVEEREYKYAAYNEWTKAAVTEIQESAAAYSMRIKIERKDGTAVTFTAPDSGRVLFHRHIPQVETGLGANNRLWCAYGTRLFVSAEGNPLSFNQFEEKREDSFTKNIADRGGKIVGIATLNGKVVVLKESTMYQIYGTDASEYYIPYTIDKGCADRDSIVNLRHKLYFLSTDGVFSFDGTKVTDTGLRRSFKKAVAQTDGDHYYLLGTDEKGEQELWVYSPESNQWYMEEVADMDKFIRIGTYLCGVCGDGRLIRFGTGEEQISWEMETKPMTANTNRNKRPGELFLRLKGARNTSMQIWLKTNREPNYRLAANLFFDKKGEEDAHVIRLSSEVEGVSVPLRAEPCDNFTLKMHGKGEMILYEGEIRSYLA